MKFLLNVGAEKAGTTWLYEYFRSHPNFHDVGKELNVLQRDDLVPTSPMVTSSFKKDLDEYFDYFQRLGEVSGDFTHYEGSTQNVLRILRDGFTKRNIDVVPVYIMRDPIKRAWSAWNMLNGGDNFSMAHPAFVLVNNWLQCKYKETVSALDQLFDDPLYFFYEDFFDQRNLDTVCSRLDIPKHNADVTRLVNKGRYDTDIPDEFISKFCLNDKNLAAVEFVFERFTNVPWKLTDYQTVSSNRTAPPVSTRPPFFAGHQT